jgi:PadR family transcriptional regulator PadR
MSRTPNASRQTRQLLGALLEQGRTWRHGYALAKEADLSSGTLYPLLIRLHDQGLLESRWQESERAGRPPRHYYRLTAAGVALAREKAVQEAVGVPRLRKLAGAT